jgi:hypothetical protein
MAEPAATTTAAVSLTGVAILALLPGVDAAVVLGAFSGAVVFVMASDELTAAKKIGFFLPSFFAGLLGASTGVKVIESALFGGVAVSPGVGALVVATTAVKLLIWLLGQNVGSLMELLRRPRP